MTRFFSVRSWLLGLMCLLPAVLGCGSKINRDGTVSGKVSLDSVSLKGGIVLFESEDGQLSAQGSINARGEYTVKEPPLGKVRIAVQTSHLKDQAAVQLPTRGQAQGSSAGMVLPDPGEVGLGYTAIPANYESGKTSGLTFIVKKGHTKHDLELTQK